MTKLLITYRKSAIGYSKDQKATVRSLGLRKLNSSAVHDDTPAIRGMAFKVRHLVTVEEVGDDAPARAPRKPATSTVIKAAPPAKTKPAASAAKPKAAAPVAKPEPKTVAPVAAAPEPVAPTSEVEAVPSEAPVAAAPEPAAAEAPVAPTSEVEAVPSEAPAKRTSPKADANDLTVIEGIGPKIASVLNGAGITTLAQLAETDVERLNEILQEADLRLAHADTWPEQAALAAAGKWDEFQELTAQLKGGRRVES